MKIMSRVTTENLSRRSLFQNFTLRYHSAYFVIKFLHAHNKYRIYIKDRPLNSHNTWNLNSKNIYIMSTYLLLLFFRNVILTINLGQLWTTLSHKVILVILNNFFLGYANWWPGTLVKDKNKKSFKLEMTFFKLSRCWLHKLQFYIIIICFLNQCSRDTI
jgi:hypothetical protein